jgi:protein-disulfide isomerase
VRGTLDSIATALLVACALCVTGLAVRREFVAPNRAASAIGAAKPRYIASWRSFDSVGIVTGSSTAPVRITEFVDYECPACRAYRGVLSEFAQRHPNQISEVFVHFPLPMHRFSQQAARAVECATQQGRFQEMRDRLFAQQDSFGLKPWSAYAAAAGVSDSDRFARCLNDSASVARILRGSKLAEKLELDGTPTVVVNGWIYPTPPTLSELEADANRIASGKPVFDSAQHAPTLTTGPQ